jgi:L-fuculose-phosphate aldolase
MYYSDFEKYGRMLWEHRLIHMTSGNMSLRKGSVIYVTRTGSLLGSLSSSDIVSVNLDNPNRDKGASSETPVHRAIYIANPGVGSVVHAHPPYATALSWDTTAIQPVDSDSLYIPEIPVLAECPYGEGSACIAEHFPKILASHHVAMIRGHGAFSVGKDLREATARISMMENQCRLLFFRGLLEK